MVTLAGVTIGREAQVGAVARALEQPGLIVIAGLPGAGKSTVARAAAAALKLPIREAGALATLSHVPGLPLSRAIRATLPIGDVHLAAEAVRARIGGAVLLVDDAQWCDRLTLSLLPELATKCRVVATLRDPSPEAEAVTSALRAAATLWVDLAPLDRAAAIKVVRASRPDLAAAPDDDPTILGVLERAGGNPLALRVLSAGGPPDATVLHGIAGLVAELPQDERTALAALGLLGRPATARLLGAGAERLQERGLVRVEQRLLVPTERFVAEIAAGVLPADQRQAMHRRLAELVGDDAEAARHLAAAGDGEAAAERAIAAARAARSLGARAELLLFAVGRDPAGVGTEVRFEAAQAALDAGLPTAARDVLSAATPTGISSRIRRTVLLAESALARGETAETAPDVLAALDETSVDATAAEPSWRVRHATSRTRLLLPVDPALATTLAEFALAELAPEAAGADLALLHAAYGEVLIALGDPRWEEQLETALEALTGSGRGDSVPDLGPAVAAVGYPIAAALIDGLREETRTAEAGRIAERWADSAAGAGAYSWEVVFRARQLWSRLHSGTDGDAVVREGTTLLDRSAPAAARAVLVPTVALAYADGGGIPAARQLLAERGHGRLAKWVAAETAWLHGDHPAALATAVELRETSESGRDLAAALATLTAARSDGAAATTEDPRRPAVVATLHALRDRSAPEFLDAARSWDGVMLRELVHCLIAAADLEPGEGSLEWLKEAESRAEAAGLALLLGRVRRALRQRGVVRRETSQSTVEGLSPREVEVMRLVARGHSTRRIAEMLGITRNTAETYVKSAMGKLGARTRTEAAVLATELVGAG